MERKVRTFAEVERDHLEKSLRDFEWNVTLTAKVLGIDRRTIYRKIEKYGLRRPPEFPVPRS